MKNMNMKERERETAQRSTRIVTPVKDRRYNSLCPNNHTSATQMLAEQQVCKLHDLELLKTITQNVTNLVKTDILFMALTFGDRFFFQILAHPVFKM